MGVDQSDIRINELAAMRPEAKTQISDNLHSLADEVIE
jgi:hypothetical protein